MDFTREPVIETVVTPKEGCKLVIRNSKGSGQEEYFVDAVEIITFGQAIFFRSLERPKPFIVPASDYEVLEVREARMVLKNVGLERSIKIGGGRENNMRAPKEVEEKADVQEPATQNAADSGQRQDARPEMRNDRKRDRRRQSKRRREVVDQSMEGEGVSNPDKGSGEERIELDPPHLPEGENAIQPNGALLASLLAPPPLISETIGRYKEQFKDAFYTKEEQESKLSLDPDHIPLASMPVIEPDASFPSIPLEQPAFGAFELSEDAEEEIYRQRKRKFLQGDDSEDSSVMSNEASSEEASREVQAQENPEE